MSATAVGAASVGGGDRPRALRRLVVGFGCFCHRHLEADPDLHDNLLDGQRPEAMAIACSGSRTDPAIVRGAAPFGFVSGWVEAAREVREEADGPVTEAGRSLIGRLGEQAAVLAGLRGPFRQVDSWGPQHPTLGAGADRAEVPA